MLATALASVVPGMAADVAAELAPVLVKAQTWPADGGFDKKKIQTSLDAMKGAGLLTADTLPTVTECCDAQFIKQGK
jgi:hypothetical protein